MQEVPITDGAGVHVGEKSALRVRDYLHILAITVAVALLLRTFIVEAYRIPSSSMENTLRVGDFLIANKIIYGSQTPRFLPLTNVDLPRFRFPALKSPERGDVIVFELPAYAQGSSISDRTNYVKRCIGLPGDTVAIVNKKIVVNGEEMEAASSGKKGMRPMFPPEFGDVRIFPKGSKFNEDQFGPVVVPKRGMMLNLNSDSFMFVKEMVEHEGHDIKLGADGIVTIDGDARDCYEVQMDYFFMMGDNRDNSLDSRFWGFVPEDLIVGRVMMIYWSWDENITGDGIGSYLAGIRWDRIGTIVR